MFSGGTTTLGLIPPVPATGPSDTARAVATGELPSGLDCPHPLDAPCQGDLQWA